MYKREWHKLKRKDGKRKCDYCDEDAAWTCFVGFDRNAVGKMKHSVWLWHTLCELHARRRVQKQPMVFDPEELKCRD